MPRELLCTLGPASLSSRVVTRLEGLGGTLFRINLSHTRLKDVRPTIEAIGSWTRVPICLDTEGAQIRTGAFLDNSVNLRENTVVRAYLRPVPGDAASFNFYPANIIEQFEEGDFISIDFNTALVQVVAIADDHVKMRVLNGGVIGSNKAVTVEREIGMPALTEKDREALAVGKEMGIDHFALSFANFGSDVDEIRDLVGNDAFVISKIETRNGLRNLQTIAAKSDAILVDRGDLSRQIPIEQVPALQKRIISACKALDRKVYVATNLLESMVTAPVPTRAEVNDVYNTLSDGADGLVLAAETAIGAYPIRCASMTVRLVREFEKPVSDVAAGFEDPITLLVEPHGGTLVHQQAAPGDLQHLSGLRKLTIGTTDLLDCEQICNGTYSPLTGFMDEATLESVLNDHRLPDGTIWTMPVLLQIDAAAARSLAPGECIALTGESGKIHYLLDVGEVGPLDCEELLAKWFGTTRKEHPGVARVKRGGDHLVAGTLRRVERLPSPYRHFELTPAQTRFVFAHKGWVRVVGFHSRNVVHRVHEYIQMEAIERTDADGLLVSPVIGPKKAGDFLPDPILKSYQTLLEFGIYPKDKVVLAGFQTYSRYAGPREAVFTALCRKNMGCSHFVIGRDHTGVGDFYSPDANQRLFEQLGDLGITPVFFDAIGYNPRTERYGALSEPGTIEPVSGTMVRECLKKHQRMPDWFMRDIVQDMLRSLVDRGEPMFCDEDLNQGACQRSRPLKSVASLRTPRQATAPNLPRG